MSDKSHNKKILSLLLYSFLNLFTLNFAFTNNYYLNNNINHDLNFELKKYNLTHKNNKKRNILGSIASALSLLAKDTHKNEHAKLRISKELSKEEQDFLIKRKAKAKKALETFLDQDIPDNKMPNIALCGSGGGLRAMFGTLGALVGLDKINLLNSVQYFSALSGSTFALSSWIAHKNSPEEIRDYLRLEFSKSFLSNFELDEVIKTGIGRILYGQKISPVNLYGALLANRLFGDFKNNAYHIKLSDSQNIIKNGDYPFPIYTAISTTKIDKKFNWFELNPFEVNFKYNKQEINIPTWSLGRKFSNCATKSKAPEHCLGFIIGICGSAFTISLEELVKMYNNSIPYLLRPSVTSIVTHTPVGKLRIIPGVIFNPIYNCPITKNTPYEKLESLYLIDAGIDFNLPVPPLLKPERKIDIIIIIDSSANVSKNAPELQKAEEYAKRHNLKFPTIDYSAISKNNISIFSSEDPQTPTVIYIPLIKNPNCSSFDPCNHKINPHLDTFNLKYSLEKSHELCYLTQFTIENNKKLFKDTILNIIKRKKS